MFNTDDVRINEMKELVTPEEILAALPRTAEATRTTVSARYDIHNILHGKDDRLLVVVGPCSIHDPIAAIDYAKRLVAQRRRFSDDLEIVMRVYFEKPRTTVGWKGLINDPYMDESFQINDGLRMARKLLLDINNLGLPAGTEFLDVISPQYVTDLISWGAIGARTTESQIHREMASGLSCAIGFKNGTDGNVKIAVDAMRSASKPHHFLSVTKTGRSAISSTIGNNDCHIILRGGKAPNYDALSVAQARMAIESAGMAGRLMIDASHANSAKNPENQVPVCQDIGRQIAGGERGIVGVMIESNLVAGRQDKVEGVDLRYGQSVTDGCIGWDATVQVLEGLAESARMRRNADKKTSSQTTASFSAKQPYFSEQIL